MGPAVGLMVAGALALFFSVAFAMIQIAKHYTDLALWSLPIAAMAAILLTGAIRMMKLRSYSLAVVAAVLALLPWSPGWVLGLPCGIWALMMLKKPEVMAAFLGDRRGLVPRMEILNRGILALPANSCRSSAPSAAIC